MRTKILIIFVISMISSTVFFIYSSNKIVYQLIAEKISFFQYGTFAILSFILSIIFFILIFSILFRRTLIYIKEIERGIRKMANGDLNSTIVVKGTDELASLSKNINFMALELKRKFENERKLEKEKNELITNVSHDLRTPLTTMIGFLRAIKEKRYESENELEEFIEIIYKKSERLEDLINNLFELTKLTGADVKMEMQNVSLNAVLKQLLHEYETILPDGIQLTTNFSPKELIIEADIKMFIRLLENLISNAMKHGVCPGDIIVKTTLEDNQFAVIQVANRSDEINMEVLDQLFNRFFQIDQSRSKGNSGLGLAIVKNIVHLHHGEVTANYHDGYFSLEVKFPLKN
jgi:signal transduction histidine kinase